MLAAGGTLGYLCGPMGQAAVTWTPYREPLRATLLRTGMIALVVGAVLAWRFGGIARWPVATVLVLWFSLGGHWVEIGFLNWLRPRLPAARAAQVAARLAVWFVGGVALALGMRATAMALGGLWRWPAWWVGGVAFIGVELAAHLALWMRGRPSFYDRRG